MILVLFRNHSETKSLIEVCFTQCLKSSHSVLYNPSLSTEERKQYLLSQPMKNIQMVSKVL